MSLRVVILRSVLVWGVVGAVACARNAAPPDKAREVKWKAPGVGWSSTPSIDASTAFFVGMHHELTAIDRKTGAVRWKAGTGMHEEFTNGSNSVVVGDVVVMGDLDLFAFDRRSGLTRWIYQSPDLDAAGDFFLTADNGTVFGASVRGRVYAVDASSGTARWIAQIPRGDSGLGITAFSPRVNRGRVFTPYTHHTGPSSGGIAALDQSSGALLWRTEFDSGHWEQSAHGAHEAPVFFKSSVIVSSENGQIFALDQETGKQLWVAPRVHDLPPAKPFIGGDTRPLAISGKYLIAGSSLGILTAYDAATGRQLWQVTPSPSSMRLLVADGDVVYVSYTGGLDAYDVRTGRALWPVTKTANDFISPPAIAEDRLFIGGFEGYYAIEKAR